MFKRITSFVCIALAASLYAAPTANEDYVDQQDLATLDAAKAYADEKIAAAAKVQSVNGKTGEVAIVAADVGAYSTAQVDAKLAAAGKVQSVNGKTGEVAIVAADVGAYSTAQVDAKLAAAGKVQSVNGKTGEVAIVAADVGAYSAASGQTLAGNVAVIASYIGGEDARAVVTNYNPGASDIPHFYLEYKNDQGQFIRVWDELTRWTRFLLPYETFTNGVNASIARLDREKAPLAYGFYDTHTGGVAPDGFFSISSEKIIIAKDMAYQKTITTSGEAWILEANEPTTITGVTSNGFFKVTDGDGNALFEIVKGDKRTVPASCGGVRTETIMGVTHLYVTFNVVADAHPTIEICSDLSTHDWKGESDSGCVANVNWTGSSGAWVAEIWGKSAEPKMFVKGTYEVGGDTYIKNTAPIGFEKVVIGGITYRVTVETVSGKKLIVLTEAL